MSEASYEFDPDNINESDEDAEVETIDNWKPSVKKSTIEPSQWRQKQIDGNYNQLPGLDELQKIHMYIKKKASDADIMHTFGIAAETLIAIKKNNYDPIDGISLDNQSKIYKEFNRLNDKIASLLRGLNHMAKIMFIDKKERDEYKNSLKKPKTTKSSKDNKCEKNEKYEDSEICEQSDEFHEE